MIVAESLALVQLSPASDVAFYRVHGFQLHHQDGVPVAAQHPVAHLAVCPQWQGVVGAPGCRIYAERPRTCVAFPVHPAQIAHPQCQCSYWFTRSWPDGTVERVGGQGSPYPAPRQEAAPDGYVDAVSRKYLPLQDRPRSPDQGCDSPSG